MGNFKKKHMGEIQEFTPTAITEYIKQAGETFEKIQKERDALKKVEISPKVRAELLGRMYFEQELLRADQIGIIKKEIISPSHDYNCNGSAWELYNYCNFALKDSHPASYFKQHTELHRFFVNESGLLVDAEMELV